MIDRARDWLADLWFDLRERRLAPVALALLAAAVAAPVILGGSADAPAADTGEAVEVLETQPAVAASVEDGIRTGVDRLGDQKAKNPFRQQLRSLPKSGEIADEAGTAGAVSSAPTQSTPTAASQDGAVKEVADRIADQIGPSSTGSSSGAVTSGTQQSEPRVVTKVKTRVKTEKVVKVAQRSIRVRFGKLGKRNRIKGLEALDALPRDSDPVVVALGADRKGKRVTFDVSSRVKSVWGKGACKPKPSRCEYLTLKPGEGAKLRYQPAGEEGAEAPEPIVYSLTLVRISTKHVDR